MRITVHHTTGKQPKRHFVNSVIGGDDQHQVGYVGLCVATCDTCTAFNVVAGNHTSIDGGTCVIHALHISCHKPCHDKGNQRQNDEIPAYLV